MIEVGESAPSFSLMGTDGKIHTLTDYQGHAVVLFFFPKAFTGTCERQISGHAQHIADFDALGAKVLGVSTDHTPSQNAFKKGCDPENKIILLSDFRHNAVKAYGIHVAEGQLPNQRATYIIDSHGVVRYAHVEASPGEWAGIDPELAALRAL
jgi:peroxiredoxin